MGLVYRDSERLLLVLGEHNERCRAGREGAAAVRPPPAAAHAEGPPGRSAGARRSARAAHRPAAPARSPDRASASDSGPLRPSVRRASRRAGRRDEDGADRGLRSCHLLFAFRRGEGRSRAAGDHRARVRFAVLRHGGRRSAAEEIAGDPRQGGARGARALHGRLRPRAGRRGRASADLQGDARHSRRRREGEASIRTPGSRAPISPPTKKPAATRC